MIQIARTKKEIIKTFEVMHQLRTQIKDEEDYISLVQLQMETDGYNLVFLEEENSVKAAAGFRISHFLAWGKILYVDDLVTSENSRGKGYGEQLFNWLEDYAKREGCDQLHLDSGVQRFDAHRFYLKRGMDITSHHFALKIK